MNHYALSRISFPTSELPNIVAALNYLRHTGIRVSCGKARAEHGEMLSLPLVFKGSKTAAEIEVGSVVDYGCTWVDFSPRASNFKSIEMARILEADLAAVSEIRIEGVLPRELVNPFEGLVGLEDQKRLVNRIADAVEAYGRDAVDGMNMVFVGNPGTGKTELARRFADHCGQRNINSGKFVSTSAADLVSNHVGETPQLVRKMFDRADGGVLFIDEAYSLTLGNGNDFGVEAAAALVECMDRLRFRVMVIAAGYPKEMELFLESNPGLRGRFAFRVNFEGYDDKQLTELYCHFAESRRFNVGDKVERCLAEQIGRLRGAEGFSSARTVRQLFDASVLAAAQNHPNVREIRLEDVSEAFAEVAASGKKRCIGFV